MSWTEQKTQLSTLKQRLDSQTKDSAIESLVTGMNAAIFRYTQTAGISQNPTTNVDYEEANRKFKQLASLQQDYQNLIKTLSTSIKNMTSNTDLTNKLQQVGSLRQDIVKLEEELQTVKKEADTSQTRQALVETPRQSLSWYQGFAGSIGFTRPLKQMSLPFLLGFGLLFLWFSGLMLKELFSPVVNAYGIDALYDRQGLFATFTDARFYAVLGGIGLVGIVLGVLASTGRLGKVVR